MAREALLREIDAEISRLEQAKALLSRGEGNRRPGRPISAAKAVGNSSAGEKRVPTVAKKRTLSAQARKKIADAQKKRWAKIRAAKK
jgi:hypothetical protein